MIQISYDEKEMDYRLADLFAEYDPMTLLKVMAKVMSEMIGGIIEYENEKSIEIAFRVNRSSD